MSANAPPSIVTAKHPRRRHGSFGDVPDMTPEEHKRRGGAADELFRRVQARDCCCQAIAR